MVVHAIIVLLHHIHAHTYNIDAAAGDQDKKDKFIVGGVVSLLFGAGMIIYGVVQSKTEYIIGGISFLATGLVALGVILIQRFRKK